MLESGAGSREIRSLSEDSTRSADHRESRDNQERVKRGEAVPGELQVPQVELLPARGAPLLFSGHREDQLSSGEV